MIYKNYLVICISFFMLFVAFNGIQNLQRQAHFHNSGVDDIFMLLNSNIGDRFELKSTALRVVLIAVLNRFKSVTKINRLQHLSPTLIPTIVQYLHRTSSINYFEVQSTVRVVLVQLLLPQFMLDWLLDRCYFQQ